ncbi:MAG TPA: single-stranded DNA-binding protein, partial [Anaerolineae bacterium]
MPALNRVQLIGNLGRDPEARFTSNGKKYATFTLAVNRNWKSAEGEKHEATDWFLVNAWGKLAEVCLSYLKKGRLVFVDGRLQTDRWDD